MSDVQYKQTKFQNSQFKAYCCKGTCKKGNVVQGKQITIRINFIAIRILCIKTLVTNVVQGRLPYFAKSKWMLPKLKNFSIYSLTKVFLKCL